MSEHIVIHGEHSGDWCLIFDQLRATDAVRPILFRPGDWSDSGRFGGIGYYPGAGINLSRNPRRAHRQALRVVENEEHEHRRRIREATRQRATIAQIKEETP